MVIRVEKCVSVGIRKSSSSSTQFLPKLNFSRKLVPVINLGESFKYLGHYIDFSMENMSTYVDSQHILSFLESTNDLMVKIDQLPCHIECKLSFYHRLVLSMIASHSTIADLSNTC